MKPFQCAIIGCGRIGCGFDDDISQKIKRTHASGYFLNKKTELVALCDIDSKKLKKYGKKYLVKNLYNNPKKMFENEKLDFVSICTLVNTHLPLVKEAAKAKVKGIFIEKPIGDSLINVRKIIDICKEKKIILIVDHQRRFEPFYQEIREFIKDGKLGKIQHVNIFYGGGIANTGSHIFDLLRFFFGEVKSVLAKKSKFKSPNALDPNLDVILEFKKGYSVILQPLDLSNYGICEIQIFGNNGRLDLDIISNVVTLQEPQSRTHDYKKLVKKNFPIKKIEKSGTILGIQNLIDCAISDKVPLCTGYDGYKSLELVIASILSSLKNKKIHLPLKNNIYKIHSK
jgi:predicted dehydrogenase